MPSGRDVKKRLQHPQRAVKQIEDLVLADREESALAGDQLKNRGRSRHVYSRPRRLHLPGSEAWLRSR